jgi:hypothetical protein
MLPDWAVRLLGGKSDGAEVQEKASEASNDVSKNASVQEIETFYKKQDMEAEPILNEAGNEVSGNPIMAKAVSPITETDTATITQMAASGDIVGAQTAANAAGIDMSEVVNQLKALTTITAANKDVYVSGKKVTDNVTRLQERSNINQFGLMGA